MAGRWLYSTKPESNETTFQSNWCDKCSAKQICNSHVPAPDEALLSGGDKGDPTLILLQATNRRQHIFYKLLVIACFLVIILYIVVIAALLKVWREPLSCSPSPPETCVSAEEVREMVRTLGGRYRGQPHESQLMQDLLPKDYHVVNGQFCFAGDSLLQHLVAGIGKVHGDVVASVNVIQNRQNQLSEGGEHFNNQAREENTGSAASIRQAEVASPRLRSSSIFAHFFVRSAAAALVPDKLSLGSLPLEPQGSLSHRQGMEVNIMKGEFTVTCAGFYFLYSHLIFTRNATETPRHLVLLKKNGSQRVLLESSGGPSSNLQGVFRLQAGDVLAVAASGRLLDTTQSNRSMYVGAYRLASGQESDWAKD